MPLHPLILHVKSKDGKVVERGRHLAPAGGGKGKKTVIKKAKVKKTHGKKVKKALDFQVIF